MKLPSIPYAASGKFAINMWVKTDKPAQGVGFEYIFSHTQKGAKPGLRTASQVCVCVIILIVDYFLANLVHGMCFMECDRNYFFLTDTRKQYMNIAV